MFLQNKVFLVIFYRRKNRNCLQEIIVANLFEFEEQSNDLVVILMI